MHPWLARFFCSNHDFRALWRDFNIHEKEFKSKKKQRWQFCDDSEFSIYAKESRSVRPHKLTHTHTISYDPSGVVCAP